MIHRPRDAHHVNRARSFDRRGYPPAYDVRPLAQRMCIVYVDDASGLMPSGFKLKLKTHPGDSSTRLARIFCPSPIFPPPLLNPFSFDVFVVFALPFASRFISFCLASALVRFGRINAYHLSKGRRFRLWSRKVVGQVDDVVGYPGFARRAMYTAGGAGVIITPNLFDESKVQTNAIVMLSNTYEGIRRT